MKRLILASLLGIGILSVQSCKKETTTTAGEEVVADSTTTQVAQPTMPTAPLTNVALSENSHNFGDVKKGESVEHTYEITNTGNNPLIISEVKPACGCTAPDYTKEPIMPGQKGKITLKFDSTNFEGMQQKQAEVFANVEASPILIMFTANVVK